MKSQQPDVWYFNLLQLFVFAALSLGALAFLSGCGSGGSPQVTQTTTISGMVIIPTSSANLARMGIKPVERQGAQTVPCGTVPAGFTVVPGADITVSGYEATATTDSNGCFTLQLTQSVSSGSADLGTIFFTAAKANAAGGRTKLKKAMNVTAGGSYRLTGSSSISVNTTIAALIAEKRLRSGGSIDPEEIEEYIATIEDHDDIKALKEAILSSAGAGGQGLDSIPDTLIARAEDVMDEPAVWGAAVTGSPVAAAGGTAAISAHIIVFGASNNISAVSSTLTPAAGSPITVAMAADTGTANLYTGSYTFPANSSSADVTYTVAITAIDTANSEISFSTGSLSIIQLGASTPIPVCGNNAQEAGEGCDDGNITAGDGCSAICQIETATPVCGNGTIETNEQCDDSNTATEACAYGQTSCTVCNTACQSVAGTTSYCGDSTTDAVNHESCDDGNAVTETCAYGQTSCTVCGATCQSVAGATSLCGDGTVQTTSGETCDDGNTVTEACAYGQTSCTICDSTCRSTSGVTSFCSDGVTDGGNGETCDDGNAVTETCAYGQTSCTVCSATCQSVAGATSYCGNGMADTGNSESCDGADLNSQTCATQGFTAGALSCDGSCAFDTSACSTCGNGIAETLSEECDGADLASTACTSLGYGGGTLACNGSCGFDISACLACGNDYIDPGEVCDGFALNNSCDTVGFTAGTLACNGSCTAYDTSACTLCGNSIIEAGEACDGDNLGSESCVTQGFASGTLYCMYCTLDTSSCSLCGNGVIDAGESCDGADLGSETCATQGYTSGALACDMCSFDTSGCI